MGVPPALSVYVKRTASAFNELVRLHKDANRKHKKSRRAVEENGNLESGIGGKEKRKKKNVGVNETVGVVEVGDQVEEKRKKRKKEEIEDEKLEDSEEKQTMEKKKKKRKLEF